MIKNILRLMGKEKNTSEIYLINEVNYLNGYKRKNFRSIERQLINSNHVTKYPESHENNLKVFVEPKHIKEGKVFKPGLHHYVSEDEIGTIYCSEFLTKAVGNLFVGDIVLMPYLCSMTKVYMTLTVTPANIKHFFYSNVFPVMILDKTKLIQSIFVPYYEKEEKEIAKKFYDNRNAFLSSALKGAPSIVTGYVENYINRILKLDLNKIKFEPDENTIKMFDVLNRGNYNYSLPWMIGKVFNSDFEFIQDRSYRHLKIGDFVLLPYRCPYTTAYIAIRVNENNIEELTNCFFGIDQTKVLVRTDDAKVNIVFEANFCRIDTISVLEQNIEEHKLNFPGLINHQELNEFHDNDKIVAEINDFSLNKEGNFTDKRLNQILEEVKEEPVIKLSDFSLNKEGTVNYPTDEEASEKITGKPKLYGELVKMYDTPSENVAVYHIYMIATKDGAITNSFAIHKVSKDLHSIDYFMNWCIETLNEQKAVNPDTIIKNCSIIKP